MAEPKFVPKEGQIDYTNIRYCPVINCVVRFGNEILLQQRSASMRLYPGCWSGASGFLDTNESIEDKVREELSEEFGISQQQITDIQVEQVLIQEAPDYGKTWIVFPVQVTLTEKVTPKINWEVAKAEWLTVQAAKKLDLLPGFENVLASFPGNLATR